MWRVLEHRRVDRQLHVAPREVLVRYEKWKDVVSLSGPPGLRLIKGFHDEALSGQWAGHRSSRLVVQWRVIYLAEASEVRILVMAVTAHDYRRAR
jgi:mRNA-degrading endonuclease YafQ of YafQ-DinJ toxin-antitoxin module